MASMPRRFARDVPRPFCRENERFLAARSGEPPAACGAPPPYSTSSCWA
jgi:hypothetical protein